VAASNPGGLRKLITAPAASARKACDIQPACSAASLRASCCKPRTREESVSDTHEPVDSSETEASRSAGLDLRRPGMVEDAVPVRPKKFSDIQLQLKNLSVAVLISGEGLFNLALLLARALKLSAIQEPRERMSESTLSEAVWRESGSAASVRQPMLKDASVKSSREDSILDSSASMTQLPLTFKGTLLNGKGPLAPSFTWFTKSITQLSLRLTMAV